MRISISSKKYQPEGKTKTVYSPWMTLLPLLTRQACSSHCNLDLWLFTIRDHHHHLFENREKAMLYISHSFSHFRASSWYSSEQVTCTKNERWKVEPKWGLEKGQLNLGSKLQRGDVRLYCESDCEVEQWQSIAMRGWWTLLGMKSWMASLWLLNLILAPLLKDFVTTLYTGLKTF